MCFEHKNDKFFVWDCVFDIKSISWHIDVIVLQIFEHRTWQFAAKGGSTSEDDELNKDAHHLSDHPTIFLFAGKGILASKAHGYMATAPGAGC